MSNENENEGIEQLEPAVAGTVTINETVGIGEALSVIARKAGKPLGHTPVMPGWICRACGKLLADKSGKPADSKETVTECCAQHPQLVDLNSARVDENMRVVAAVHLDSE